MVGRYIIEDEYTINVKLQRSGANSPLLSFSPDGTLSGSLPPHAPPFEAVSKGNKKRSFVFNFRHSDHPDIASQLMDGTQVSASSQTTGSFTPVPLSNAHNIIDASHLRGAASSQNANQLLALGAAGEKNLVRKCVCEKTQHQPCMGEEGTSFVKCGVPNNWEFGLNPRKMGRSASLNPPLSSGAEKKQSKVKMIVVASDSHKSPTFKPVSGFAHPDVLEQGYKTPLSDLKPMQLISSFGEVVPLKPAEGFVFANRQVKMTPETRFYTEHTAIVHSPTTETNQPPVQLGLPSVKVFDEDDNLVSKNTYVVPRLSSNEGKSLGEHNSPNQQRPKISISRTSFQNPNSHLACASKKTDLDLRSHSTKGNFASRPASRHHGSFSSGFVPKSPKSDPTPKPRGPGSLFIKPLGQHSTTGSGELYVAPIDSSVIQGSAPHVAHGSTRSARKMKERKHIPSNRTGLCGYDIYTDIHIPPNSPSLQAVSHDDVSCLVRISPAVEGRGVCFPSQQFQQSTKMPSQTRYFRPKENFNKLQVGFDERPSHGMLTPCATAECISNTNKSFHLIDEECQSANFLPALKRNRILTKSSCYPTPECANFSHLKNPCASEYLQSPLHPNHSFSRLYKVNAPSQASLLQTTVFSSCPNGLSTHNTDPAFHSPPQKSEARALLSEVLASRMSCMSPAKHGYRSFPVSQSKTTSFEGLLKTDQANTEKRSYNKDVPRIFPSSSSLQQSSSSLLKKTPTVDGKPEIRNGSCRHSRSGEQKTRKDCFSSPFYPCDEQRTPSCPRASPRKRTPNFLTLTGERVPGLYANPGPTTLTSPGHDLNEESSTSTPTYFNSRDLESKGETMLVTNEPLSAPHIPHGHRTYGGTENNLINVTLKGNPRAVKYLIEDRVSNSSAPPVFEGCENFAFDGSYGQDNPGFDTFSYLPIGDSRSLDPGYGSEKSEEEDKEEDEDSDSSSDEESNLRHSFLEPPQGIRLDVEYLMKIFPFINEATMFDVTIVKNSRGLGLAVTGGVECESGVLPGLIRIRKLYPQTPAWLCGQLQINDFILEANGMQLTGLTSHEALEVLRTEGREVHLVLCRAPEEVLNASEESSPTETKDCGIVTTSLTAPQPILGGHFLSPSPSFSTCGEFEIHLRKVSGSLGFTLRKNDNSILGHTIRSLVKEPAISDGRLKPGDKLLSVNGTDMCGLSHEEAVQFLRTCSESVVIRIYRDAMQTPVSPASPTEPEFLKPKALRKEARDMLTDLAFRKQSLHHLASDPHAEVPATPRRRRLNKNSSPDSKEERWESLVREAEASSRNTIDTIDSREVSPFDNSNSDTLTAVSSQSETSGSRSPSGNSYNDLSVMNLSQSPANSSCSEFRPKRPNFLDLNSSHSSSKKSQFTPPHEEFPSPPAAGRQFDSLDSAPQLTSTHSDTPAFSHLQTAYRSVNAVSSLSPFAEQRLTNTSSDHNISSHAQGTDSPHKKNALLKWKGVVFTPEEEESERKDENYFGSDFLDTSDSSASHESQVVTLELTRGWNSRLGFSLQNNGDDTAIVAIYAESVAAKDGRLRIGDIILEVNGNDVRSCDSQSVIELLRKTRGKICLKIFRKQT